MMHPHTSLRGSAAYHAASTIYHVAGMHVSTCVLSAVQRLMSCWSELMSTSDYHSEILWTHFFALSITDSNDYYVSASVLTFSSTCADWKLLALGGRHMLHAAGTSCFSRCAQGTYVQQHACCWCIPFIHVWPGLSSAVSLYRSTA